MRTLAAFAIGATWGLICVALGIPLWVNFAVAFTLGWYWTDIYNKIVGK
jgi:hypothetical protein